MALPLIRFDLLLLLHHGVTNQTVVEERTKYTLESRNQCNVTSRKEIVAVLL